MKRNIKNILAFGLQSMGLFTSCTQENKWLSGEGKLNLKVKVTGDVNIINRSRAKAVSTIEDSCKIYIRNEKGLVRKYVGINNIPAELWLVTGDYRVEVIAGDSVSAAFNTPYYKGSSPFTITPNEVAQTSVTCKIANTLAEVIFAPSVNNVLKDYHVTVFTSSGSLTFDSTTADLIGYYMLNGNETDLGWSLEGIKGDGTPYTQAGMIKNVKATTKYKMTFNYSEEDYHDGGAILDIQVDETTLDITDEIVIAKRPEISGNGFNIASPVYCEVGIGSAVSVWINASSELKNLVLSCDKFTSLGIPVNEFDFITMTPDAYNTVSSLGISLKRAYNEETDQDNAKVILSEPFIQSLPEGQYSVRISATDSNNKNQTATLNITISDATVMTNPVVSHEVWATRATLRGSKLKETDKPLQFNYRIVGETNWTTVDGILGPNGEFTANITGLIPGKEYEYQAKAGDVISSVTQTFKTDAAPQLPNNSFENWSKGDKDVALIYGTGESMFWDSGNHGSITMGVNVTEYDDTTFHSGRYSVRLKSQFVGISASIGKFAAGNLFSGKFAGMSGMDGNLDFGRKFTARPAKLKGYFRYNAGIVDKANISKVPDMPNGSTDIGQIFIALGDWDAPVAISTAGPKLFDKNDSHIIAYGELLQTTNTPWTEFTITLDYRSLERIPKYIIVVASASKNGDYFVGSTKSTMWLDDLELIYE